MAVLHEGTKSTLNRLSRSRKCPSGKPTESGLTIESHNSSIPTIDAEIVDFNDHEI